ncbi:alpha/beta fold hydrolase [Rhizobium puerariae]|uniref:Alpha/beta fold hydrolase n=1 Tax=Rhizobium puerariae TaxID=1585791 RepID=A0ABV6AA04_9HYPH
MKTLHEFDLPFEGTTVHCWEGGSGVPIILLHGSGAGVGTHSNFKKVIGPLSRKYHVLAADLVGFGRSGLKPDKPFYDMDMWVRQARMLIDRFAGEPAVLVGHSLSGSIVLKAAAGSPHVRGVLTTGTTGMPPVEGRPGPRWRFPEGHDAVRAAVERTFYDKSLATDEEVDNRLAVLTAPGYRDYFTSMFSESPNHYLNAAALRDAELASITCPVVFMHGFQDASFAPEDTSLPLARRVANSKVIVLNRCAHSVAVEHAPTFLAAVDELVARTATNSHN